MSQLTELIWIGNTLWPRGEVIGLAFLVVVGSIILFTVLTDDGDHR